MILVMPKDVKTPLILGRPFLATGIELIDVELGKLIFRFNKEKVIFIVFEATRHHNENP